MRRKEVVTATKIGREVFYALSSPDIEDAVRNAIGVSEKQNGNIDLASLASSYAQAAIQGDETVCGEIVDVALRQGANQLDIYELLITPAMQLVDHWCSSGTISEGRERLATGITERLIYRVIQSRTPTRRANLTAVLGCCENNLHTLGLRMVGDYLKISGWRTFYLGANVPKSAFIGVVREALADLVLISSSGPTILECIDLVRDLSDLRSELGSGFRIIVGGPDITVHEKALAAAGADEISKNLRVFAEHVLPTLERSLVRGKSSARLL